MIFLMYPRCTTCKKAQKWLVDNGIDFTARDIKTDKPTAKELATWHKLSALPLKKFFNTSGASYKDLGLKDKLPSMTENEQLKLLASDGMLVKRPLLIDRDIALVGFKEAEWSEKLLGKKTPKVNTQRPGCVAAFVMKITLKGIRPPVWRRIVVPQKTNFQKLGEIFLVAMGWSGYHLSEFYMPTAGTYITMPTPLDDNYIFDGGFDNDSLLAKKIKLTEYLPEESTFMFVYDMGDYWEHKITVEKVIDDYEFNYPQVLAYEQNCPPEDCGGAWGYMDMLEDPDAYDEDDLPQREEYDLAFVNNALKKYRVRA